MVKHHLRQCTQFRERVSDRSVALAASCSSVFGDLCVISYWIDTLVLKLREILISTLLHHHQCRDLLYKRFLTPFHDGVWNRRQVSVGDRGVLPTRPKNHRGQALLAHWLGKNEFVCDLEGHRNPIISVHIYIPHDESQKNISAHMYITHNFLCGNVCARCPNANSSLPEAVCDCQLIEHANFLETVCVV